MLLGGGGSLPFVKASFFPQDILITGIMQGSAVWQRLAPQCYMFVYYNQNLCDVFHVTDITVMF